MYQIRFFLVFMKKNNSFIYSPLCFRICNHWSNWEGVCRSLAKNCKCSQCYRLRALAIFLILWFFVISKHFARIVGIMEHQKNPVWLLLMLSKLLLLFCFFWIFLLFKNFQTGNARDSLNFESQLVCVNPCTINLFHNYNTL